MKEFLKKHNWTIREVFLLTALVLVLAVACAPAVSAALDPDPIEVTILNRGENSVHWWTWQKIEFVDPETGISIVKKCLVYENRSYRIGGPAYCK